MTLLSEATYRHFTKDQITSSDDVVQACIDGQSLVEDLLRRPLESMDRTEDMCVEYGGLGVIQAFDARCYPLATPITVVPDDYSILGDAILVPGDANTLGDIPGPFFGYDNELPAIVTIEYTGGYTAENLPTTLMRAIAEAAFGLTRILSSAVPLGATSVKVGDISVSYGPNGASSAAQGSVLTTFTMATLKKYKRRNV